MSRDPSRMPAVALAAMPGRRKATIELGREMERRGFSGIYCASFGDGMGLCEALALTTERIRFGTAIAILYTRHPSDYAQSASFIHELSGGRFDFGIGVSHGPVHKRLGLSAGKPLADVRRFVADVRAVPRIGELPPIVLAALRDPMVRLAGDIADGMVFANAARSHMGHSIALLPEEKRGSDAFFVGNMIPTCISDDVAAAAAVNRKTLTGYALLPNYREYWKAAGYVEEMEAVERAVAAGQHDRVPELLSDRWLADTTLFGPAAKVREGVEAWLDAGVRTPILVPSSASGGQLKAIEEMFAAFA
jgi:alkanesulfonate monooxygenase SsuD/methylene tetrahydromethanopterin reductase-like flavin-dependent oxidoreductase (luciferase family)